MVPPLVRRYLIALDRHKWAGLAGFVVVTGLSGVVAFLQPPPATTYQAQGILAYSAPPETFSATNTALQQQGQAVSKEGLLSGDVVELASQQLEALDIKVSPDALQQNAKVNLSGQAQEGEEGSGGILRVSVGYLSTNGDRSQAIVLALMEAMVEQSRAFNSQQLNRILENLNQLLPKVSAELQTAEQNLQTFIRAEGSLIDSAALSNVLGSISANQQQQRDLRFTLAGIDAELASLQQRLGLSPDQAYAASALSADPLVATLRAEIYRIESQMELLSSTLRSEHPTMVDLQNQLDTFEQQLQSRVVEVLGGQVPASIVNNIRIASSLDPTRQQLANNLVNLQTQRETLQQQLLNLIRTEQELRQEYTTIPDKQLEQQRLEQQVALKRAFYDQVQARLADVRLAQQETVGSLVIAQEPMVQPQPPTGLSGIVILIVGGVVGVVVGAGLVLLLGSMDPTFQTLQDLQAALKQQEVPILGELPILPWDPETELLPVIERPNSPFIDPYERLRSNLRRIGGGKALKLMVLTSTIGAEGKTTTAYNLAIASARAGRRTLLIEADLRKASCAAALQIELDPASILDPLSYYGNPSDCIRLSPIENLYVVPSVGPQRHAAAILESSEIRQLLEDARGRFDWVILDTPPLNRCNDALLLEPYTDGLALVTRPGNTEEGLLNEATQEFVESTTVRFLGAIINGAEIAVLEEEDDELDAANSTAGDRDSASDAYGAEYEANGEGQADPAEERNQRGSVSVAERQRRS